jgi:hypothetical protein
VTDYCNYPPEARRKTHVGGMINPSIEALLGLNPDLVVLSMEGNMRSNSSESSPAGRTARTGLCSNLLRGSARPARALRNRPYGHSSLYQWNLSWWRDGILLCMNC